MTLEGYLALLDAVDRARPPLKLDVHPTTREVARTARLSRQMAAHYLRELEREGFCRGRGWEHVAWRLTPRGAQLLERARPEAAVADA
jgi:DNA-binding IclR family transcriptional regulator